MDTNLTDCIPFNGWHPRSCAQSMRLPTSRGFYRHLQSVPLSVCGSLMLQKNPPLCPYLRKIKSHAWMTGGPLLWHPSSASVLRSSSETTSALCCLPHWTHYNLHTAETVPQTTLSPSPCTLLSPTWKIRTPMWGCCSWIIVQHLTPYSACHTGWEAPDSGTEQISVQLDPGLPDRQKSGGQNGQQHLISPDPQHWCPAGLRSQPTPVLPVHTRLYSYTQLQRHRQICRWHNGDRPDHRQWWDGLQRGGEYPD